MPAMWEAKTAFATAWRYGVAPNLRRRFRQITDLLDDETVLVSSQMSCFAARLVQDALDIPLVTAWVSPLQFMSSHVPMELKVRNRPWLSPHIAKAAKTWFIDHFVGDRLCKNDINHVRQDLGLAPVSSIIRRWVHSPLASVGLFPSWFSPPQPDWPSAAALTGFPLFDMSSSLAPNVELEQFLFNGPPPVLVATGSAMSNGKAYFTTAVDALRGLNLRGIVLTSAPEQLPALPSGFMHCPGVALPSVLPRIRAFIHHGGIGTMAQAFAAGVPQLIVPSAMDQIDNAARICRIGAGLQLAMPICTSTLSQALQTLLEDQTMARRRESICKQMEMDSGVLACARAADLIERVGRDHLPAGERSHVERRSSALAD